jgi:transcriptional regulator with XRE-family HTH domain
MAYEKAVDNWRKRLQDRIDALGLSPREVTRRAGVNPTMVHDILNKGSTPSVENLFRIAQALGMTLTELYEGTERVQVLLPINGIATEKNMWAELPPRHARVVPLEVFNEATVSIEISTDDYLPRFERGDIISGVRFSGPHLHNLLGRDCIVALANGERRIGILIQSSVHGLFTIRSLNPRQPDVHDAKIAWAAPIRMIVRGGP